MMKRLACILTHAALLCATVGAQAPGGVLGEWNARIERKVEVKDALPADFICRFTVSADGRAQGTFDIPLTGSEDLPIESVTVTGQNVRISFAALGFEFQGKFEPGGAAIAGSLTRDGRAAPMRLTLVTRTPAPRAAPEPAPKEVVDWFRSAAIPLKTTDPGHGFGDLRPFRELVGNARIVSMGEATHGTREFFQLKHRMLEFLVTEMGFTVFAIEANWPESLALNRYVLTGEGDPVEGLNGLHFWTCDSQEVLDMVRWMREYNQDPAHTHKVKFYGFDAQFVSAAVRNVLAFLGRTDPGAAKEFAGATEALTAQDRASGVPEFDSVSDDRRRQIGAIAGELVRSFDGKRAQYAGRSSEAEWKIARQNAVIVQQAAKANEPEARDRIMAENVKWILDQEEPGAKIALWAHNNHVQTSEPRVGPVTMGMHLRRLFGDAMVVVGFAFNQGEFRAFNAAARRLLTFTALPAPVDSLDAALTSTGLPLFAVDLRRAPSAGPVSEWLMQEHNSREIGWEFTPALERRYEQPFRITQSFDLLLFVERTTAARQIAP